MSERNPKNKSTKGAILSLLFVSLVLLIQAGFYVTIFLSRYYPNDLLAIVSAENEIL